MVSGYFAPGLVTFLDGAYVADGKAENIWWCRHMLNCILTNISMIRFVIPERDLFKQSLRDRREIAILAALFQRANEQSVVPRSYLETGELDHE